MSDQPAEPRVTRRQVNVRLPVELVEQIDARRHRKDLSRDSWVERALTFALSFNPEDNPASLETSAGRTAPPPHRR